MMKVMEDRKVRWLNLELQPRNPHGKAGNKERRWWLTHLSVKNFLLSLHDGFSSFCYIVGYFQNQNNMKNLVVLSSILRFFEFVFSRVLIISIINQPNNAFTAIWIL